MKKSIKILLTFLLIIFSAQLFNSCYSHTGSSLNPEIKSINIATFPNLSALTNPNLSQDFTNMLQDRFDQRTKLSLVNSPDADLMLEGEITSYTFTPINIVSGDVSAQNRLTINVRVRYENKIFPEKSFEKTFSDYDDISSTVDIATAEQTLSENINKRLIDQIFNAIVADW